MEMNFLTCQQHNDKKSSQQFTATWTSIISLIIIIIGLQH